MLLLICLRSATLQFGDRFCGTDQYASMVPAPEPLATVGPALLGREEWKPMRVVIDMARVKTLEDCTESNCSHTTLLSNEKKDILRTIFNNLEDYLSQMLKVSPEVSPVDGYQADLVIKASTGYFSEDDKTLAYAWQSGRSEQLGRPNRGSITINPRYIPDVPEDVNSVDRFFFTVIFHELMHVLGMMGGEWSRWWIDQETGKKYSHQVFTTFENRTLHKTYRILHTPKLHAWAVDRFGVTEFAPGVPAGIEIEDGGGSGTAGSHPESRIYMSEVMCGIFVGRAFISNMSLAILDDTGWYVVNYSLGEPFPFGDGKSMETEPLSDFPTAPPQLSFPEHYLCWDREDVPICHHDFTSKGYCSPVTDWVCPGSTSDDREACAMKEFVNPRELPFRGDRSEFDYLYFKVGNMSEMCDDDDWNILPEVDDTGEIYGSDSMCAMSTLSKTQKLTKPQPRCHTMICDETNTISVIIDDEIRFCSEKGQTLTFSGYNGSFICPDPKLLCSMKRFLAKRPVFNNTNVRTPIPTKIAYTEEKEAQRNNSAISTAIVFVAITIVTLVILVAVYTSCRKRSAIQDEVKEVLNPDEPRLDIPIPDEEAVL